MKARSTIGAALIVTITMMLTLLPSVSYAKEGRGAEKKEFKFGIIKQEKKEKEEDRKGEEKREERKEKSRCRAWGYFIAQGWLKKNGTTTIPEDCDPPKGIAKKLFSGWKWTTPPQTGTSTDVSAPTISDIRSWPLNKAVFLTWKSNEPTDSALYWSTATPFVVTGSSSPQLTRSTRTKIHQVLIPGLSASTTYYAVIRARDAMGNTTFSTQFSFATRGAATSTSIPDTTAPIISVVSLVAGSSTLGVNWTTNELSNSMVFYSTSTPVIMSTSSTPFIHSSSLVTNHTLTITGLSGTTTYYLKLESTDAAGNTVTSSEYSTTTSSI